MAQDQIRKTLLDLQNSLSNSFFTNITWQIFMSINVNPKWHVPYIPKESDYSLRPPCTNLILLCECLSQIEKYTLLLLSIFQPSTYAPPYESMWAHHSTKRRLNFGIFTTNVVEVENIQSKQGRSMRSTLFDFFSRRRLCPPHLPIEQDICGACRQEQPIVDLEATTELVQCDVCLCWIHFECANYNGQGFASASIAVLPTVDGNSQIPRRTKSEDPANHSERRRCKHKGPLG